jgi:hypothetical protein
MMDITGRGRKGYQMIKRKRREREREETETERRDRLATLEILVHT